MKDIHQIARTGAGYEFYSAEIIAQMCKKEHPQSWVTVTVLDSINSQDLLIINQAQLPVLRELLVNYTFLGALGEERLYLSNKLTR